MNEAKEKCPVCGSEEFEAIYAGGGGEYGAYLYSDKYGSVHLLGCTHCGVLRLSKEDLARIERRKANKKGVK